MGLSLARRRELRPGGRILVFDLSQEPNRTLILYPDKRLAVEKTLFGTGPRHNPDIPGIAARVCGGGDEELGRRPRRTLAASLSIWRFASGFH